MLRLKMPPLFILMSLFGAFASLSVAEVSVNGYANIIIPDADNDPYYIAIELRKQAQQLGLKVYILPKEVPPKDLSKTCFAAWSWEGSGPYSGKIHMRLLDTLSNRMIVEADGAAFRWVSLKAAVSRGVTKVWEGIGYSGFSESDHLKNIEALFPKRPVLSIDEASFKNRRPSSALEGIWSDLDNVYTLAITPSDEGQEFDYVGVVLRSNNSLWKAGEIKLELKRTAVPNAYVGNFYPADKQRQGVTSILENGVKLSFQLKDPSGNEATATFVKSWPAADASNEGVPPSESDIGTRAGSGFMLDARGLVATNWHVVKDAHKLEVIFPQSSRSFGARIAIKDSTNDLAILEMTDYSPEQAGCVSLPYEIRRASQVRLGDKVSTIGYPLQGILGSGPKYSDGVVATVTGLDDDPRCLQISAAIQPGSSGSPLFDRDGNVVGIVVSSLNADYLYSSLQAIPQNVNFAIKSDYLLNLVEMLPGRSSSVVRKAASVEARSKCIVQVHSTREENAAGPLLASQTIERNELEGVWNGVASNFSLGVSAPIQVTLRYAPGKLSGQILVSKPLAGSGPFEGVMNSDRLHGRSVGEGFTIDWDGQISGGKITGSYTVIENSQRGTWWVVK